MLLFTLTGIVAYLLTLAATLPARLLLDRAGSPDIWLAAAGTVWNGEAALAHGHAIRWRWAPLASIANLAFSTEIEVTGAGTNLKGAAAWRPSGLVVTDLNGDASASLLAALVPTLPFVCEFPMEVEMERIAFGGEAPGAAGSVRTFAGNCSARNNTVAASVPVPALVGEATINVGGSTGWVAPRMDRSVKLISFSVAPNGGASFEVSPAAAALFPGAVTTRIEP